MAICPFTEWRPLPENKTADHIDPRVAILHTAVSNARSLWSFFNSPGENLETHFYVRSDGTAEQYLDTDRQADGNRDANDFAVSVENQDNAASPIVPMTDAQLAMNIRIFSWLSDVHPKIKRQRCDRWDGSGYGYHTMWGAPSHWTPVVGKTCPSPSRIKQFEEIMIPTLLGFDDEEWPYMDNVAFVRDAFIRYLGRRVTSQTELDMHVIFLAQNGQARFLTNLADSTESVAYRKKVNEFFGFPNRA